MPTTRLLEEDEFLARATAQYARDCMRTRCGFQQPSNDSEITGNRIALSNQNGELATYEARRDARGHVRLVRIESDESFLHETQRAPKGVVRLVRLPLEVA